MQSLLAVTATPHNSCKTSPGSKPHSESHYGGYRVRLRTFSSGNRRIRGAG
jgi:hypothetical protein